LLGRRGERLSRAAENLGVLVGPRAVRRELEPVASSTPFRPSVPQAVPKVRAITRRRDGRSLSPRGLVLLYHRIAELDDDPLGLAVTPAHFAEQLEVLRDRTLVPLEAIATDEAPRAAIAVTFDDGYADNIALEDAGIPVTLFVSTGHVEAQRGFWWDAITAVNRERQGERVEVEDRAFILGDVARRHMTQWLQPRAPDEIAAVLETLGATPRPEVLTVEQVRELAHAGVTIGAHTRTHRSLRHASPDEQRDEIERSRDDVERFTGMRPAAFSYPFGVPGDAFDATATRLVEAAGFACAVQNDPAAGGGRFALPRHTVPDVGGQAFARWLDDAASTLARRWRR
jgi:peptidoglycan/xylan/chitin deacetylase (PgdA/CDA1 family)